jgi:hypothetical protein
MIAANRDDARFEGHTVGAGGGDRAWRNLTAQATELTPYKHGLKVTGL